MAHDRRPIAGAPGPPMIRRTTAADERCEAAAEWVVRLAAPDLSEAEALAFDAWLAASGDNRAAYEAALAVWIEFSAEAPAVLAGLRAERGVRPRWGLRPRYAAIAAMGAAAAAAAAAVIVPALGPATVAQAYATAAGEHRSVTLADGTRIDLNAATRLTVAYRRHERDVTLAEGEAVFDVTHDLRRPFVIAAGDRAVRVVGTEFDVRRRAGQLSVSVARGAVEVVPAGEAPGEAFRLHPGQRLEHAEGAAQARIALIAPDEALSWRSGRLVYRGEPLAQVVADLNAQFRKPIRIADPALAAEPISGVLVLDDETAVVRRLALLVSAHTVPSDGGVILQRNETPPKR